MTPLARIRQLAQSVLAGVQAAEDGPGIPEDDPRLPEVVAALEEADSSVWFLTEEEQ